MKTKFINVKTGEKVKLEIDRDVFYSPYLGHIKDSDGRIMGHQHVPAYADRKGNEYRKDLSHFIVKGSPFKLDYNK